MSWTMDPRKLPNGTVLFLGISYPGLTEDRDATRGRTMPKVWTYALLKAGGVWYTSGSGKVPQAAGWGAVERWLERDNRVLEWVKIMTSVEDVYTAPTVAGLPASPETDVAERRAERLSLEPGLG